MSGKIEFKRLLEPYHIGCVKLKNRFIKTTSSMGYQYDATNFFMSERYIQFSEAMAKGGVGLIIAEGGILDYPLGAHDLWFFRMDDDEYVPGWAQLAKAVHQYECPIFAQLIHAGPWHKPKLSGLQPVASSANIQVEEGGDPSPTRELTIPEIEGIVDKFAAAAERYQKAGIDGVEINASGNHLLDSFLSRAFNRRNDAYGCQSIENRSRIVVDILKEIKRRLGSDFPVSVLINGVEYGVENGLTIEETQGMSRIFEEAGADCIHVRVDGVGKYLSSHYPELIHYPEPPKPLGEMLDGRYHGAGGYVPVAAAIKKSVSIPVIAVGRLDPKMGEDILKEGKADFIGMTKRLLADPELPNKVASGRLEDIAPCTACEHCISFRILREPVRCRINAALSSENGYSVVPADQKKKVLIIGGGPAGMEAARVAALRGHDVTLFEKGRKLGGLLPVAGVVKGFELEDLDTIVTYLKTQITKLGVNIRLKETFHPDCLDEIRPDVIIVAVGGIPVIPAIPGINHRKVVSVPDLHRMLKMFLRIIGPRVLREMTRLWMPIGKKVVIIGGAIHGSEVAEFMVKRGRSVTIIAGTEILADGLPRRKQQRLLEWFEEKGVTIITEAECEAITDKGLTIKTKDGKRQTIEADTVIPAVPLKPDTELLSVLNGKGLDIYTIGDCMEPRLIIDSIADGWRIANAI